MSHPLLALLLQVALGLFVIRFARQAFIHQDTTLRRWFSYLPETDWARTLLRGFSALWVFGGILIVLNGFVPFVSIYAGPYLVALSLLIAVAGSFLVLRPRKPKSR